MQMENNWKVMKEENGKQHNGQNMLKESGHETLFAIRARRFAQAATT